MWLVAPVLAERTFLSSQKVLLDGADLLNEDSIIWASLVTQMVKNLPAMHETGVWSMGWKDPLEKEMATHSSILS